MILHRRARSSVTLTGVGNSSPRAQIRRARRQLNRLHAGALQDLQEFSGEQGIPVVDQVSLPGQKAFRSVTEVPSDTGSPNLGSP